MCSLPGNFAAFYCGHLVVARKGAPRVKAGFPVGDACQMRDHLFLEVNWDVATNCISREFGGLVVPARGSGQQTVLWGSQTNAVSPRGQ